MGGGEEGGALTGMVIGIVGERRIVCFGGEERHMYPELLNSP